MGEMFIKLRKTDNVQDILSNETCCVLSDTFLEKMKTLQISNGYTEDEDNIMSTYNYY